VGKATSETEPTGGTGTTGETARYIAWLKMPTVSSPRMHSNSDAPSAARASLDRRRFLRAGSVGAAAAAGLAAAPASVSAQYGDWLSDVPNYDGTHDYRGRDEVTVAVGAGENGLVFGPAAILVDPGTTVVWEWTGAGGAHNVVADDGPFDSGETVGEAGHTFEYTFSDATSGDVFAYLCTPHQAVGMKGVVAIGESDDQLVTPGDGADGGETDDGMDGDGTNGTATAENETAASTDGQRGDGLTAGDIVALALGLGVAGALLVPLFYAAHQRAERE
jgi:halocyanin-like protein